ncbi:hypothetical protein [Streptomyces sp. WMMC940]|uniref:hypothetical protein n=1 Tax=Streptomyces sp. WMMC940 TaxID=3015153 RepID=UPI0022B66EB0|nr:hypothetical protein [Streptomyces sp. WMMC940]MCZ7461920.1 hypothetical protein [Streptomyces sp. WMMC940]
MDRQCFPGSQASEAVGILETPAIVELTEGVLVATCDLDEESVGGGTVCGGGSAGAGSSWDG